MRRAPFAVVALLLAASVALGGCVSSAIDGSDGLSTSTQGTEAAATGERVTGQGYALNIPEGWETHPDAATDQRVDIVAADAAAASDTARTNLNVVLSPAGAVTKEQVETLATKELENAGTTNVRTGESIDVDGVESLSLLADYSGESGSLAIIQTYVLAPEQTYIVTFTFPGDTSEADQWALVRSVLASWEWDA